MYITSVSTIALAKSMMPRLVPLSFVRAFREPFVAVSARRAVHTNERLSGVENVLNQAKAGTTLSKPTIWGEFSLKGRIGIVSGGNRGLGLEMSLALCELGARMYVIDLPKSPSEDFKVVADHVAALGENRALEYISADVTLQQELWAKVEESESSS